MDTKKQTAKSFRVIRNVYLYLVAMIGLITLIFGAVGLIDNVMKNYVFQVDETFYYDPYSFAGRGGVCNQQYVDPKDPSGTTMLAPTEAEIADCEVNMEKQREQTRRNEMGRQFSIAIAQIAVGLPIWLFHWGVIQKEYRRKKEDKEIT